MGPPPHLQRKTSFSLRPAAPLPAPQMQPLGGPVRAKNLLPSPRDAWGRRPEAGAFGEQESQDKGLGMGQKGGLPVTSSRPLVPVLSSPASTLLLAHSIFLMLSPEPASPHSLPLTLL